ncbi:MAG TPA: hypothetical protein VIW25_11465 [Nitrososphaeraceae archaeon]
MKRAGEKKLSKVVSTKLTDKDYELCQRIAREYYIKGNTIRTPAVSELARLALELIFSTRRPSPIVDNLLKSQPRLVAQLLKALHSNQIDNIDDEFAALSRSKRGEDIAIEEIKKAVVKAIQILLGKLKPSDGLMENLSIAYAALEE